MSCPFGHDDGAYLLGALSPTERLAFERHLSGCAECTRAVRTFAGLPGLLSRVEPSLLDELMSEEPVPDTLLPSLARQVGRRRRRRTVLAAGLAAAAVVAAVAVTAVVEPLGDDTPAGGPGSVAAPSAVAMAPVGDVPVRAQVAMEQVTWGTRLDLTCTYDPASVDDELPPEVDYVLFVSTRDGHLEQVGSWRSVGGKTMRLSAATAADHQEIASVQVRTLDGRVVLETDG
jgi:hypothetical protein